MSNVSREEIKNLIHETFVEKDKMTAAFGCQTTIGCGKTKEIETYINGKLKSDLFDICTAQEKVMKILEKMTSDINGMHSLMQFDETDMHNKMLTYKKEITADLVKTQEKFEKRNQQFNFWALATIVTLLGAKLFQDYTNQNQLNGFLRPMLESVAVLQEHDKDFQKHIKEGETRNVH
jgi:hypothetical protein